MTNTEKKTNRNKNIISNFHLNKSSLFSWPPLVHVISPTMENLRHHHHKSFILLVLIVVQSFWKIFANNSDVIILCKISERSLQMRNLLLYNVIHIESDKPPNEKASREVQLVADILSIKKWEFQKYIDCSRYPINPIMRIPTRFYMW